MAKVRARVAAGDPATVPVRAHYRPATDAARECATCSAFASGICTMFPNNPPVSPSYVCDEWEEGEAVPAPPRHLGAAHHNAVLEAAYARVDELEPKLVAVLEPILRRAGNEAARRFKQYATNHLTAAGPLTADGQPPPPDWTAPAADELIDTDALAAQFRGKTDPIRLALIQEVLGATLGTPGVTEEEAIAFYHSPSAFELNEALRSGKPLTREQQSIINALDKAMRPSESDMVLYRGVPNAADVLGTTSLSKIEGSQYETAGYVSTSETMETAEQFAGGIAGAGDSPLVMEIRVPKGTPMLQIPAGDFGDQQEWLLPRDLRIGMGTAERYEDPFGENTIKVTSTALNKGTLSSSTAGVAEGAGLSFDVANPLIDSLIAKTGEHIKGIADTTQANVMRAIGSAYQEGLTIPDTATLIQTVMGEESTTRAVMIARTEMSGAVHGASLAAAHLVSQATGKAMTKTWLTASGARFPRHEEYDGLDGQTVAQEAAFTVGDSELQYPGDPDGDPSEVVNCRCSMVFSDGSEVEAE